MRTGLYAIIDNKAIDIVLSLIQSHPIAAMRAFGDVLTNKSMPIGNHPADYDLVMLGTLTNEIVRDNKVVYDDFRIEPNYHVVLTGEDWLAAQQPKPAPAGEAPPPVAGNRPRSLRGA